MAEFSNIEWTDATFNPWVGCQKVSPGCDHCYAETLNKFRKWNGGTWGPHAPRERTSDANWRKLLRLGRQAAKSGKSRRVFCASLADVFDNKAPDGVRISSALSAKRRCSTG
jgi:protein gp37